MADIKLTPEQMKEQAAQMNSLQTQYEGLFRGVNSELKAMNQNWSPLLANNFLGKISSAQKGFSAIESMLGAGASAVLQSAKTMESVDGVLAKLMKENSSVHKGSSGSAHGGKGKAAKGSTILSGLKSDFDDAVEVQRKINRFMDKFSKTEKNVIKILFKKVTEGKDSKLNIPSEAKAAYSVWSKLADGKYADAVGDFIEAVGGKTFDAESGSINWTGVKVSALAKTFKLVLNGESYLSKNADKYEELATEHLLKGDVAGCAGAAAGMFVQTVGKGSVDVLCQTASSVLDGAVSAGTGGKLTLSSMNQAMYDLVGTSPGHVFNSMTKAVSDGVDVIVDKGLVEGMKTIEKANETLISKAASKIGGLFG